MPPPKLPKPPMFSGEGEDLKPDKLKRLLRTVKKHLARSGLNDDSPEVADYHGAYTDGKAKNAYQTLDREVEDLTLAQLTQRLQQLFEASTNTDDSYHKWQNIRQTAGGQPARIMRIAGELADLKGSLPAGSVSDYAQKQRFLDTIDSRLRRNVEPQLRPEDPWDQMVAVAERYDATMYRTGGYKAAIEARLLAAKPIHQRKKVPTANPLPHQCPGTQAKERPQPRRRSIPNPTSQVRFKWTTARQKERVSTVVKVDTWQMNAQRKKLRPTMFACLRKAQIAAKANMSRIQTAQRS